GFVARTGEEKFRRAAVEAGEGLGLAPDVPWLVFGPVEAETPHLARGGRGDEGNVAEDVVERTHGGVVQIAEGLESLPERQIPALHRIVEDFARVVDHEEIVAHRT